ncbi:RNA-directed DNA polymerase [Salinispora arenicola]|uniref:HNH endonuclease n=1 Tax=Salinispora arenicola TaxID=168697 RepID=UPI002E320E56|nr:RNA-directed DNA polymerase [Salinispora arenicola]
MKRRCEACEQTGHMNVHHVRTLAELGSPGPTQPAWAAVMARRQRKALVVCDTCHDHIHAGQPTTLTA